MEYNFVDLDSQNVKFNEKKVLRNITLTENVPIIPKCRNKVKRLAVRWIKYKTAFV